ncbi:hypothetical protein ABZ153_22360 [Streptomyces sp. NPDC006290]|uniref:hypothetical protein n=1 Tax=Streptomyces sp. NPDC006290 TaxID=3156745 RepID=UPI0033AD9D65
MTFSVTPARRSPRRHRPRLRHRPAARVPLKAEADASKYDKVTFSWKRGDADG